MICPKCNNENIPGAKFCNECGSPLADSGPLYGMPEDAAAKAEPIKSKIPDIKIPGVNAYENGDDAGDFSYEGDDFDFSPIDGAPDETEALYASLPDDGLGPDMRGLDEMLVEPGYIPPSPTWKTGDTMEMPRIEGQEPQRQKEYKAPDAPESSRRKPLKPILIVLVLLVVIGAGAAAVTYGLEMWGGRSVPNVIGMNKVDAAVELEALGFEVRTTEVKSDDVADSVLLMDPGAGGRYPEGTEVVLHVAVARTVPDVLGKTQEEAAKAFEAEGFEKVEFVPEKSNEAEGTVLSVAPEIGTQQKSSAAITVKVAQAYTVPDTAGQDEATATATLNDEGYLVYVEYIYSDAQPGTVVNSKPAAGEKLAQGETVTIQVAKSRGAELVELTSGYLSGISSVTIGNTSYQLESVDGTPAYQGGNTVTCAVTVRAVGELDGETVYGSAKSRTLTFVWNDANELESIS